MFQFTNFLELSGSITIQNVSLQQAKNTYTKSVAMNVKLGLRVVPELVMGLGWAPTKNYLNGWGVWQSL